MLTRHALDDASVSSLREQIVDVGRRMWLRGMVASNDGNVSARVPGQDLILCTPTGVSKGAMRAEELVLIDLAGRVVGPVPSRGPSSEMKMHLRVYERRSDVQAVVHAHPVYATAFAVAGEELTGLMMTETAVAMPKVPLAPFATPSTAEVPDSIEPFVRDFDACLLEFHGALTWGGNLEDAYLAMERVESLAHSMATLRGLGVQRELGDVRLARMRRALKGDEMARSAR